MKFINPNNSVEASPFQVSDEHKASIAKGDSPRTIHDTEIKYDGYDYFGLVRIGNELQRVEQGDYIIESEGLPIKVMKKEDFEASHQEPIEDQEPNKESENKIPQPSAN